MQHGQGCTAANMRAYSLGYSIRGTVVPGHRGQVDSDVAYEDVSDGY